MTRLLLRLGLFAVALALVVAAATWSWSELQARRHPVQIWSEQMLEQRLGTMTPEQRQIAEAALQRDPLAAVIAAESRGWAGLERFAENGPDEILTIQRLALDAGRRGDVGRSAAVGFTNAAFTQYVLATNVDPELQATMLANIAKLSPGEYRNVAYDGSYLLIAPRLPETHSTTFRDYQDILTPMLVAADTSEWNKLLQKFENALPDVSRIARSPKLGNLYAMVFMLHADLVRALQRAGVTEQESLDFVGANAAVLATVNVEPNVIASRITRLRGEFGPDGQASLFEWACVDPAIYWLVAKSERSDSPSDRANAITVLNHYAGQAIPQILTNYADEEACFRAAVEALIRFDNFDDPDPARRQTAAKFLSYFQNDPGFKAQLGIHGARLVPALSAGGGEKALAAISRNGNDIDRYVTEDGSPITGKPWWTWVPGGNIAFLARELAHGRTTETSDWIWASVDILLFVPVGEVSVPIRIGTTAGKSATRRVLARGAEAVAEETAAKVVGRVTIKETLALLRQAGVRLSEKALMMAKQGARFAGKHPALVSAASLTVYCSLYPKQSAQILDKCEEWVVDRLIAIAREAGRAAMGMPGEIIGGIFEKAAELKDKHPIAALWFYLLAIGLALFAFLLPLLVLRWLLPELFQLLKHWSISALRLAGLCVGWLIKTLAPKRRPTA